MCQLVVIHSYNQENTGFSDHNLIKTSVSFKSNIERGPGVWKNNVRYYSDESFLEEFSNFWTECKELNSALYVQDITKWWMDGLQVQV